MINQFKDYQTHYESGIVYYSNLLQVQELYQTDREKAGELAISILEMALTGELSSNDPMMSILLKNFEFSAHANQVKYETKIAVSQQKEIEKYQLREIAQMTRAGVVQQVIADTLGISRQAVNNRVRMIHQKYPYLLDAPLVNGINSMEV